MKSNFIVRYYDSDVAYKYKHVFHFENQELSLDKSGNLGGWIYEIMMKKLRMVVGAFE